MGLFSGVKNAVSSVFGGSSGSQSSGNLSGFGNFVSSVGSNAVNSLVNSYFNNKAARKQFNYTKSLIDYENQYNLPVNQRARLEEAGYNPNLALNGVNVQSVTGSAPQVKPAQVDLLQAYNLEAQNELLRAQRNLTVDNSLLAQEKWNDVRSKVQLAQYNLDYAEAEHKLWEKTGKIPQSYYKSDWQAELTSLIKGLFN